MRILYVIESALPYGSNRSLIGIIRHFHNIGMEIAVAGKGDGPMQEWIESLGIKYFPINIEFLIYSRSNTVLRKILFPLLTIWRLTANVTSLFKLTTTCKIFKPDLIHTNIGPVSIGYYVSRIIGIKHIWHLREFQDRDFGMGFFPTKAAYLSRLNKSEAVICVSKAVARHFGRPQDSVIYNGVGTKNDIPPNGERERTFLFAANLQPTKGVEEVLSAYLDFASRGLPEFKLIIIGGGKDGYVKKLHSLAGAQGVIGNIQFLGYRDDISPWMRRAKSVIVASKHEGFGRVAAEAMLNGCLVIGKESAGTAEILEPWLGSQIGLLFNDGDSLVDRMIEVAHMTEENYQTITLNAQRKAIRLFSTEESAERILGIYKKLTN